MRYNFTSNPISKFRLLITICLSLFFSSLAAGNNPGRDTLDFSENSGQVGIRSLIFKKTSNPFAIQKTNIDEPVSPGLISNFLSGLHLGGYYRGYALSRTMSDPYGTIGENKVLTMGDGYLDPVMFLYVGGAPSPTTSFGTELMLLNPWNPYSGSGRGFADIEPFFTMVLRGSANTKIGNFYGRAGGIEWHALSPFTFGSNVGFQRFSIFERRPWDPVGNIKSRYASYYYTGTIDQDMRFGTRAFKGFMVSGTNMPFNTSMEVFYGKTQFTGGIGREHYVRPASNAGFKLNKFLKNNNRVSINTFNSFSTSDSINTPTDIIWNIFTAEFDLNIKDIGIYAEIGYGGYESPNYPRSWGEGIIADIRIPKKYTFLPIYLRYFQIHKAFTNNVANFTNNSNLEVNLGYQNYGPALPIEPFGGGIMTVGDLANNQRGFALNTEASIWKFKFIAGAQMSSEIEKLDNGTALTYSHAINNLLWSRLPGYFPLPGPYGPNERVSTFYRGAFERVTLTDLNPDGTPMYKKHFNGMDFQAKFKNQIFDRDFYWFYLGRFNSAQNKFSPVTIFSDEAYIRTYYHETEMYYQIHRNFILALYAGVEFIKANMDTELGVYGLPRDQRGEGIGIGFDFALSSQTSLFFRQRWVAYEDKNFEEEKFRGREATLELKIFF